MEQVASFGVTTDSTNQKTFRTPSDTFHPCRWQAGPHRPNRYQAHRDQARITLCRFGKFLREHVTSAGLQAVVGTAPRRAADALDDAPTLSSQCSLRLY